MTPLTRPALARLAAACAAAVPATLVAHAPAGANDPLLIWSCTTTTIPPEELEEGAVADIDCEWVEQGEFAGLYLSSGLVGTHYDGTSGGGDILNVSGSCGEGLAFGASDPWNNIISSTRQRSCGVIKHFEHANFSGDVYVHDGPTNSLHNLGTMSNRTSAITYDP